MISLKDNESFILSYMHYDRGQYNTLYGGKVRSLLKSIVNFENWNIFFHQSVSNEIERFNSNKTSNDCNAYESYCNVFTMIPSSPINCRERVRFGVQRNPYDNQLSYVMWEGGSPSVYIEVRSFTHVKTFGFCVDYFLRTFQLHRLLLLS